MNRPTIAALAAVSTLFLTACSTDSSDTADSGASSADTVTVTESPAATDDTATDSATADSPEQQPTTVTETAQATLPEDPGATGIADEVNPAPYASNLIFPEQPGLQFTGPDGTFCEMYGSPGEGIDGPAAMCTYQGQGDENAVSVRQGSPAQAHNVNRIFMAHENTVTLPAGSRLANGPVTCEVAEGDVMVHCFLDGSGFYVSQSGVSLY